MNVWTDGETTVVLGARGLSVHDAEGARRILGEEQLGMAPPSPSRSGWRWATRRMLAVTPGAERALFSNGAGEPVLATLDGAPPEILPVRIVEAVALGGDRFAAVHIARLKGRDVARLGIGTLPLKKRTKWSIDLDPARPNRVDWPNVIWADGVNPPWSRARCSTSSSDVRLDSNRFGLALADSASGTIAVVRPGGRSFESVMRIPAQAEGRCWASCTERGVVVGLCIEGREGAIVRFDERGRPVVWVERDGLGPGHVTDDGELVYAMIGEQELRLADADSLDDAAAHLFGGEDATGDPSLWVVGRNGKGGHAIALGLGHHVISFEGELASGESHRVEQPEDAPISEPPMAADDADSARPAPAVERVRGPAQLSLDPTRKTPEWSFESGANFEIRVPVVSIGGGAKGLFIELAGDAVDRGIIAPEGAEVAGQRVGEARFDGGKRVSLPEYEVEAGAVLPDAKKVRERFASAPADMFHTVVIRGKVAAAGAGLLTVRVGFEGAGNTGSLMRGRSISVQ
jgi:hypothetical protein